MRFLHTADWHLGRLFHGASLLEEQAHALEEIVDLVSESRPDAVLLAGDVFDRAVPPTEAVALLDEVLTRIVDERGVRVIAIAGNHDSPVRLDFGGRLLARRGLHFRGAVVAEPRPLRLEDADGPVDVYPLPYAEPPIVREALSEDGVSDHDGAMRSRLARLGARTVRRVVVAHAYVDGGAGSESERPLSVGGAGTVGADAFAGFDYVALGHLHRPQVAGEERVRYSGSLLKYSFSEIEDEKGVLVVELDREGRCRVESVPIAPLRDVRRVEGTLEELLRSEPSDDYLLVALLDRGPIFDPVGRLREVFPNVLSVERSSDPGVASLEGPAIDHRRISDEDLFAAFFRQVTGSDLEAPERAAFARVAESARREEREVAT